MNNQYGKKFLAESSWEKGRKTEQMRRTGIELPVSAGSRIITLPEPEMLADHHVNFLEMVELRSTVRQYSKDALSLKELSYLLWCTQGVKAVKNNMTLRTVPSAGGSHSFETYLLINNVEGLEPGVYRFLAVEHALTEITVNKSVIEECFSTVNTVKNSAVTFIWSSVIERLSWYYGERAYRYVFLDAGHVCQNLYASAQTISAGVCPLGAFDDRKINAAFKFDVAQQFVVYGAAVGKL